MAEDAGKIETLLAIMAKLRDPDGGCPWDLEQDFASIAPYTIEEAYEVADAIERGDMEELRDELGHLLLQVVLHAQMASEHGAFDFSAVVRAICEKMIRRHPHVFGSEDERSAGEVKPAGKRSRRRRRPRRERCRQAFWTMCRWRSRLSPAP